MGRPSQVQPLLPGPSRRAFFKRSGAVTVGAAAALPLSPLAQAAGAPDASVFQHGVASGDPLADRVILWTRVTPPVLRPAVVVQWTVASDAEFRHIVLRGVAKTHPGRDYTVKVDATGLQPASTYYYRFTAEGVDSPIGRTRTLPVGDVARLRLAVVSCSNHAYGYFNAYARLAERADLDLVLHLGDYLYEYGAGQYGTARTPEPAGEMVSLADYRQRHAQYKRDVDAQAMHRQHPMVAIWDDHEIANDSWKDGAENHSSATEGEWTARVAAGLQAYFEWMPVRVPDTANLRKDWRGFNLGNLVQLTLLEERLGARSKQLAASIATPFGKGFVQSGAFTDASRTLLGAEQEAWLDARLNTAGPRWKLIGQGVMFAQLKVQGAPNAQGGGVFLNPDQWDGYQPARDRVYAMIKGSSTRPAVDNVVMLTGDIHSSWAADLTQDPNNPDLASGGYDAATGAGAHAVEFVGTSVSSPGVDSDTTGQIAGTLRAINPHFKYIHLHRRGYMLLDITPARVVCEWWYVDTVASRSHVQEFGAAFEVAHGSQRLSPSAQTRPKANPPALAP